MRPAPILGIVAVSILALLSLLWSLIDLARNDAISAEGARPRLGHVFAAVDCPASSVAASEDPVATFGGGEERTEVARSIASLDFTCLIRVVRTSSGVPVPDAQVWLQREDVDWTSAAWMKEMRRFNDVEPVLQSGLGTELALDARGEVRVPRPTRELCLAAARGALHGEAKLRPGDAECIVELEFFHSLTCEVVDRSGNPVAGAFVAIYGGEFDPLDYQWWGYTGADGRVWIPKLEEQVGSDSFRGPMRISLAAGVPCEPEVVDFTLDSVPTEPVRFVASEFGSVAVQVTDRKGMELALDGHAFLNIQLDSISDPSLALRAGDSVELALDDGRALFECVGLNLPIEINVGVKGHANVWRDALGPTTPGEEIQVLIPLGERRAVARGRVHGVDASFGGARPPGARLQGRPVEGYASFSDWVLEGEIVDCSIWHGESIGKLGVPWTLELYREGGPVLRATVVPTLDEERMVVDFGDMLFDPQPVLARVRVIDDTGAVVEGARVERSSDTGMSTSHCDGEGRCVVAGQSSELPLSLRATHRGWLPSPWTPVDSPGEALDLVLRRGASLEGQLVLPRAGSLDDFGLALRIEPTATSPNESRYGGDLVEGGRFRFEACEPGLGSLTVYYAELLVLERRIELLAGKTSRLEPIDLTVALYPFELAFQIEGGEPWSRGSLEMAEPKSELWMSIGRSGRTSFLAPSPAVDLWVGGRGARVTFFDDVVDGDRLTLRRAPSAALRLPPEVRLPRPPLVLMVHGNRIHPETVEYEPDDDWDVEDAVVREDGTASLRMPWPGDYELDWFVRHTETGVDFWIGSTQTIHVPEPPASPIIEAELAADAVAAAILEAGG